MCSLSTLKKINDQAARKARKQTRITCDHSGYTGTIEGGIILHSGKHRETRLLRHAAAHNFVNAWMDIPAEMAAKGYRAPFHAIQARRDALVESYF
jgi:hypothetical protein